MTQRITVGRITRQTNNEVHDVFIMPTGRLYYRRNMGQYEGGIPPGLGKPLVELRRCVNQVKDHVVHHLQGDDMYQPRSTLRKLVEPYHCEFATQPLDVDASAL